MATPTGATSGSRAYISRSHRAPYTVIATFEQPLGVDIERIERLDRAFAESICTPTERERLRPRFAEPALVASLWSGKEALAKALGDALDYDPRRLESPLLWRDGACGRWRARELLEVPSGHVGWIVWAAPGATGAQRGVAPARTPCVRIRRDRLTQA